MHGNTRIIRPELLDHAAAPDAVRSLHDLVRINRMLGGYGALRRLLRGAAPPANFTLLDIGAASGDMDAKIREWYPGARITSLDYRALHLAAALPPKIVADAFALPLRERSFDYVFCSLFLHHFENQAIVRLFREFGAVARRAVLAIDLERGPLAKHFLPWTKPFFRWHPITLHDGPISVDASFKKNELLDLARKAGFHSARVERHRPWARLSLYAPLD